MSATTCGSEIPFTLPRNWRPDLHRRLLVALVVFLALANVLATVSLVGSWANQHHGFADAAAASRFDSSVDDLH
jgi:hypothetical protein